MIVNIGQKKEEINFTDDQKVAVDGLIDFIAKDWDNNNYINSLIGAGGVGKSFVTKYIINNCKYSSSVIICAAPTHKACRVLSNAIGGKKVNTIQSLFGFRLDVDIENFNPENPAFTPKGKIKLIEKEYKVLIIDEASMLNFELVKYINNFCCKHRIKIIYIGDSSQLAPVGEKISRAFVTSSTVYLLKKVVRQGANNPISDILNMLRKDILNKKYDTLNYLSMLKERTVINDEGKGFILCNPKEFDYYIEQAFTNEEYTKNVNMYKIIAYTNAKVTTWNKYIRTHIIKDSDKNIITKHDLLMSYTTIVNDFNESVINNSEDYIVYDIGNFQDPDYDFKCYMVKFQAIVGGKVTSPLCIIDHTDKDTLYRYYKVVNDLINTAKSASANNRGACWARYYDFKNRYLLATNILNTAGKTIYSRDIDYGFAITSHRAQGSTYNTVFVDVNDIVYDKYNRPYTDQDDLLRRLYVACSRASDKLILCYGM